MSQQIKDAFVKLYGTEEAYGNKHAYSGLYVVFFRGWNACKEAAEQSAPPTVLCTCGEDEDCLAHYPRPATQ